jgi:hypothetical protein
MPLSLYYRGKSPWYPLHRRLCGPQIRPGRCGKMKILYPTRTRTPTPRSPSPQAVAIPTTLQRLLQILVKPSKSPYLFNRLYSCRDETTVSVDRFMHYTLRPPGNHQVERTEEHLKTIGSYILDERRLEMLR